MADVEEVIQGLELCSKGNCLGNDCPYKKYQIAEWCRSVLEKDAAELLKVQRATIQSLHGRIYDLEEEIRDIKLDVCMGWE